MHHAEDHNSHAEEFDAADDAAGHLIPFPRIAPEQDDTWITGRDWRVDRIDTEPMTRQQHDAAVTALAALINQWLTKRDNTNQAHHGNAEKGVEDNDAA
jgi:hypothetical protein